MIQDAVSHGVTIRFDTSFVSFEQTDDRVETILLDQISGQEYTVTSKYLVAADGANSKVVSELGLVLSMKPQGPMVLNILCEVDLTKHMEGREGNLHWVLASNSFLTTDPPSRRKAACVGLVE
jgi:2,4-dichlorophenol 6-monooxygenase